jgi:hypothetical protein
MSRSCDPGYFSTVSNERSILDTDLLNPRLNFAEDRDILLLIVFLILIRILLLLSSGLRIERQKEQD